MARSLRGRRRVRLALALAAVAGFVDAVGYASLHELFVAHMTGNSDLLGRHLGQTELAAAVPLIVAVGVFVGSIALATVGLELAAWRTRRSPPAFAIAFEALLVGALLGYGSLALHGDVLPEGRTSFYVVAVLAIAAMGVQAAGLAKWESRTIRTTYISGMLTRLGQELANRAVGARGRERRQSWLRDELRLDEPSGAPRRAAVYLGLWLAFVAGGVAAAFLVPHWHWHALALPLGVLVAAAAVELRRPSSALADAGLAEHDLDGAREDVPRDVRRERELHPR